MTAGSMETVTPRRLAPMREPRTAADRRFALHCLNRDWTNFAMLRYRDYQGFLVTGQNSGTQWLKFMLSLALAAEHGVEPPKYFNNASSNDIIGHPKHKRKYPQLPRIASAHSIPHAALPTLYGSMNFPPYVVLVRDIRGALISNYAKWRERYQVPFDVYVAGDPSGESYVCDVWWYVRFLNAWGRMAAVKPIRCSGRKRWRSCAAFSGPICDTTSVMTTASKRRHRRQRQPNSEFRRFGLRIVVR